MKLLLLQLTSITNKRVSLTTLKAQSVQQNERLNGQIVNDNQYDTRLPDFWIFLSTVLFSRAFRSMLISEKYLYKVLHKNTLAIPPFRIPLSGDHCKALLACLKIDIRSVCPVNLNLLFAMFSVGLLCTGLIKQTQ